MQTLLSNSFCVSPSSSSSIPLPNRDAGENAFCLPPEIAYFIIKRPVMDWSCHQIGFLATPSGIFNFSLKCFWVCWCCMSDFCENVLNPISCLPAILGCTGSLSIWDVLSVLGELPIVLLMKDASWCFRKKSVWSFNWFLNYFFSFPLGVYFEIKSILCLFW